MYLAALYMLLVVYIYCTSTEEYINSTVCVLFVLCTVARTYAL